MAQPSVMNTYVKYYPGPTWQKAIWPVMDFGNYVSDVTLDI